jgi:hypothetical protein
VTGKLRVVNLAELQAQEQARLAALDAQSAGRALVEAVRALARHEADRIDVPFLDPTYHGCDPIWRATLDAASDLNAVLAREVAS